MNNTFSLNTFAVFVALTAPCFASTAAKPPTVDPTYGMTVAAPVAHPSPLAADWIWTARTVDQQTVYLRRDFTLKTAPRSAILHVTADDGL